MRRGFLSASLLTLKAFSSRSVSLSGVSLPSSGSVKNSMPSGLLLFSGSASAGVSSASSSSAEASSASSASAGASSASSASAGASSASSASAGASSASSASAGASSVSSASAGASSFGFLGLGGSFFGLLGLGGEIQVGPGLLAHGLDRLDVIGDAVFVPILRRGLGRCAQRQPAEVGVVSARDDDGLPGRGDERLDQRVLVAGFFKHPAVHAHRALPVLLVHEGQQLAELSQKFLFIDGSHLRLLQWLRLRYYSRKAPKGQEKRAETRRRAPKAENGDALSPDLHFLLSERGALWYADRR